MKGLPRSLGGQALVLEAVALAVLVGVLGVSQYAAIQRQIVSDVIGGGEVVGTAVAGILSEHPDMIADGSFKRVAQRFIGTIPNVTRVLLTDSKGQVLFELNEAGHFVIDSRSGEGHASFPEAQTALAANRSSTRRVGESNVVRTVQVIESDYDPVRRTSLIGALVIEQSLAFTAPAVRQLFARTMTAWLLLVLVIGAAQWTFLRRGPIAALRALGEAAARFGSGDHAARSVVRGSDEIATVARAFNDMAARIERDQDTLRRSEQMKTDFVSFASHQLRTPLSGMKWMLELAASAPGLPAAAADYVADARASCTRLVSLVNDLLDTARLERGSMTMECAPVRLDEVIQSVVGEFRPVAAGKRQQVSVATSPLVVSGDAQLLRQVIANLVSNAVKYTPDEGTIRVRLAGDRGDAVLSVQDSGIGIPAAAQSRLFEKFFRADNAVLQETEGTGLGLHLAKLIVERTGGQVWFESMEGSGTTFHVRLPQGRA